MGARHVRLGDGQWLQPEPLLALGIPQGAELVPESWFGAYAAGDTAQLNDNSGYCPFCVAALAFLAKEAATEAVVQAAYAVNPTLGTVVEAVATFTSPRKAGTKVAREAGEVLLKKAATEVTSEGAEAVAKKAVRDGADDAAGVVASKVDDVGGRVDDAVEGATAGVCFTAGHLVATPTGPVNIEEIEVDDWVYAEDITDDQYHRTVARRVLATYARIADGVIDAHIAYQDGTNDVLSATPNHPFWVPSVQDYVELQDLEVGTVLRTYGGSEATVLGLTWKPGEVEVYDIEVEGLHNFFVRGPGSDAPGVLVHNSTPGPVTGYRAVEAGELADIQATGGFRTGPSGEMGKGFFTTDEAASNFAQGMSNQGRGPYTTVKTEIPGDVAKRADSYSPAAEGDAMFIMDDDLPLLGAPEVQDAMALPK